MSKLTKNYGWLNTRPNSAKTLMERAKREIPGFKEHIRKLRISELRSCPKGRNDDARAALTVIRPSAICTIGNRNSFNHDDVCI
jgi:molybdopterin biosynthesis enzyme MoaB